MGTENDSIFYADHGHHRYSQRQQFCGGLPVRSNERCMRIESSSPQEQITDTERGNNYEKHNEKCMGAENDSIIHADNGHLWNDK